MQEDIRKKVFLDVFVSKSTLLPVVAGGTVSLISLAADQYLLAFGGAAAVVVGIGVFLTRFLFNLESVTEDAFNYLQEQKKVEFEESLIKLSQELNNEEAMQFQVLRGVYGYHKQRIEEGCVRDENLEKKIDQLFHACVEQLKYANELHKNCQYLTKDAKKDVMEKRQKVLTEVKDSVKCMNTIIDEIRTLSTEKSVRSLSDLRDDVKSSLEIVKRTEERVAKLDNGSE